MTHFVRAQAVLRFDNAQNVQKVNDAFPKSADRSLGSSFGMEIVRGILGSLFGGSKRP